MQGNIRELTKGQGNVAEVSGKNLVGNNYLLLTSSLWVYTSTLLRALYGLF